MTGLGMSNRIQSNNVMGNGHSLRAFVYIKAKGYANKVQESPD
jgi:hypothetical protein